MTPEDRTPRKRRRRRRRPAGEGQPAGNGNGGPQPGNEAQRSSQNFGDGGGGRRRRRQRHRTGRPNRPGDARMPESSAPIPTDIPASELTPVSGVLYLKVNGAGMLVNFLNNYVPQPGDAVVPRSVIEKLHLQPGLHLAGNARRSQNGNLEMIALEAVEGMPLEEYRESRRPFS